MLVADIISAARSYLHDATGSVWSDDELRRHLNDGYRQLIAGSLPVVRIFQLDIPARDTGAGTQEWEDEHVSGLYRRFTTPIQNLHWQGTYRWEAEFLAGSITPTNSYDCCTHDWERSFVSDNVDNHFRFVLARTHEMPRYAFWGDKRLGSRSVSELDLRDQRWWVEAGEPVVYLSGVGRELSFEIFEVESTYTQAYWLRDYETGAPREITSDASRTYDVATGLALWDYAYSSGEDYLANLGLHFGGNDDSPVGLGFRFTTLDTTDNYYYTFSWEEDFSTTTDADSAYVVTQGWEVEFVGQNDIYLGLGLLRGIESEDRQYLPMAYDSGRENHGIARDFHSSDDSISIYEHITPGRTLLDDDAPELIPSQLHFLLKYYIIGTVLSQPGEGYRPDLAQHWLALYNLGVGILAALATPSFAESSLARGQAREVRAPTPPSVRLPSTYPRVRGR